MVRNRHAALHPQLTCADRPGPLALASVLAAAAEGQPFRIGAPDLGRPPPGPVPVFETLTSGSSGTPRRIRRTQASWTASFAINAPCSASAPAPPSPSPAPQPIAGTLRRA